MLTDPLTPWFFHGQRCARCGHEPGHDHDVQAFLAGRCWSWRQVPGGPQFPICAACDLIEASVRAAQREAWWQMCGGAPDAYPLHRCDPLAVASELAALRALAGL